MYRNKKLLEIVRESPCQNCGTRDGTVVAAHANLLRLGKGRGIKCPDYYVAALCYSCHMELDQGNKLSKAEREEMWIEAYLKTIGWLFENEHLLLK
jgi:hypothetical protein